MKIKNMSFWLFILISIVLLFVQGCGPQTTGKKFDIDNAFNITNNTGTITISPDLTGSSGDTKQDVVAPTTTTNDVPLDLTIPLSSAASGLQGAIESEVSGKLQEAAEEVVSDPVAPVAEDTLLGESLGSWSCSEYTRIPGNPKSTCRIATDFKKHTYPVTFVFDNDCGSFTVASGVGRYEDLPNGKEDYVYYDYEKGTPAVFTQANCVASKVTAYKAD